MYKVLTPIKNTYKAVHWCRANFGDPTTKVILRSWRNGGNIRVLDEENSRWSYRRNKKTSTWKFKNSGDAVMFKLAWYEPLDKK